MEENEGYMHSIKTADENVANVNRNILGMKQKTGCCSAYSQWFHKPCS